ncbi:MAG: transglutaminase family protein [Gammaproteobacteria bacterium]
MSSEGTEFERLEPDEGFWQDIADHDAAVARVGIPVWIGAEPTFTCRRSESPQWLFEALGEEKLERAAALTRELRSQQPGSVVLRSLGRQYAGEPRPRWSLGRYGRRDGRPVWSGPPDPLDHDLPVAPLRPDQLERCWRLLEAACGSAGWSVCGFAVAEDDSLRLLVRTDGRHVVPEPASDPRLRRPAAHVAPIPRSGLNDELAAEGYGLLTLRAEGEAGTGQFASLELPVFGAVGEFLDCLALVGVAASEAGLPALVIRGFPPPVDDSVVWTTVTPDPAVVEVNLAPQADTASFTARMVELYALAERVGLSPYRLQYTGVVSDSGGGGQFTLGGPTALASPFFRAPALLPRWVRYLNHHPSLSYWFATDYVGSASQSPRADESAPERLEELELALASLARTPAPEPQALWETLAPFLADPAGNAHRSELNIEKLWNPYLPERGCLGLVEFRAFRMPRTPRRAGAIAALLRALTAMLMEHDPAPGLIRWGRDLRDRFALPLFLRQDLRAVLDDLAGVDLGLGETLSRELLEDVHWPVWTVRLGEVELVVERAVEFWPLVGDVASQEAGGSRAVDSSTSRLQVVLRAVAGAGLALEDFELGVAGCRLPLRWVPGSEGSLAVAGLRYREFSPGRGLHPGIAPLGPVELSLRSLRSGQGVRAVLHAWRPGGNAYDGLPEDLDEAARRRSERWEVTPLETRPAAPLPEAPPAACSGYTVDLRWLQVG